MRVLGICQRGGYTSLKILPVRVVARNAAPPIENTSENISSGFIENGVGQQVCTFHQWLHEWSKCLEKVEKDIST